MNKGQGVVVPVRATGGRQQPLLEPPRGKHPEYGLLEGQYVLPVVLSAECGRYGAQPHIAAAQEKPVEQEQVLLRHQPEPDRGVEEKPQRDHVGYDRFTPVERDKGHDHGKDTGYIEIDHNTAPGSGLHTGLFQVIPLLYG